MPAVVEVEALTKTYGRKRKRGVEDVSFEVRKGEVFGFLGPNGAGKTTTLRVLLDLLRPTSGEARVFGLDCRRDRREIHARTGYLPGETGLFERMTVREQLRDLGDLRGGVPRERIEHYARLFDLDLDKSMRALSRGNKQKAGLVQALMHEPELLILDEPTSGLDPLMQQRFNAVVRQARADGRTVFLSSHILPEVELLCDRVAIIRDGRILTVSTVPEVKRRAKRSVTVHLAKTAPPTALGLVPGVADLDFRERSVTFHLSGALGPVLAELQKYGVEDVVTREPTLEDVFLGFYGGDS